MQKRRQSLLAKSDRARVIFTINIYIHTQETLPTLLVWIQKVATEVRMQAPLTPKTAGWHTP